MTRGPIIIALVVAGLVLTGLGSAAPAAPPEDPQDVDANGWTFTVDNTPTDGLAVTDGWFNGKRVFRRISVPQIRVFYSANPTMRDQLGTGGSANVPYVAGSLAVGIDDQRIDVRARYQEDEWPNAHSYRYDIRYLFYASGQFRTRVYAYGPGLEPSQRYVADIRVDLDLRSRGNDYYQRYFKGNWVSPRVECKCQDQGGHDGKAEWMLFDGASGTGFEIWPRTDDGRPALWGLQWHDGEGNSDLGATFAPPAAFDDNEDLQNENLVVWYRSFGRYDRPSECPPKCWTPAVLGPIFQPIDL